MPLSADPVCKFRLERERLQVDGKRDAQCGRGKHIAVANRDAGPDSQLVLGFTPRRREGTGGASSPGRAARNRARVILVAPQPAEFTGEWNADPVEPAVRATFPKGSDLERVSSSS